MPDVGGKMRTDILLITGATHPSSPKTLPRSHGPQPHGDSRDGTVGQRDPSLGSVLPSYDTLALGMTHIPTYLTNLFS